MKKEFRGKIDLQTLSLNIGAKSYSVLKKQSKNGSTYYSIMNGDKSIGGFKLSNKGKYSGSLGEYYLHFYPSNGIVHFKHKSSSTNKFGYQSPKVNKKVNWRDSMYY
jgi:hypothetical protein